MTFLSSSYQRIFIVGNSDNIPINLKINEKDLIVRFNQPNKSCTLKANLLFVANGPRMIIRKTLIANNMLQDNCSVVWRYSISNILLSRYEKISITRKLRYPFYFSHFKKINKLNNIPAIYYEQNMQDHCTKLVKGAIPSTGFLAIFMLKEMYPHTPIYIHNFTFQGWEGHDWNIEEKIIQDWIHTKKIQLAVASF